MPDVSDHDLFEMATLVHREWAKAFDARKHVRSETDDGSMDWTLFHAARLKGAEADFAKWDALYRRITPLLPHI